MEIYIKEKNTNKEIRIPWLPDKIIFKAGGQQFASYSILDLGEVKVPNGSGLRNFEWESYLPGENRMGQAFLKGEWIDPRQYQIIFSEWKTYGTPLRLIITGTTINHDVYLEDYEIIYSGGFGDYNYKVSFVENRDMIISSSGLNSSNTTNSIKRPDEGISDTYTVVSGDTLFGIAQRLLKDGSKYLEIYNLNKDIISNPNLIIVGQVLKIPN